MENINWKEVQEYYDDNHFWDDLIIKFKLNTTKISKAIKQGLLKTRSNSESKILSNKLKPRTHSEETKKLISKRRKEFLEKNPDKVPYLMNHYSKGDSYPEQYFEDILKKYNINYIKKYRIHTYELDFAILDKKIDIEIDGSQHVLDKRIVESDKKRTEYLEINDWTVIRVNWSEYKKSDKKDYIEKLINYINDLTISKPTFLIINKINNHKNLCECGNIKDKKAKQCTICQHIKQRKVERPSYEQLIEELKNSNYLQIGKKYGVSDNSIRKWLKNYEK